MKKILLVSLVVLSSSSAFAEYVRGYVRQNGTYVQPHFQTAPDNSMYNNYSTQGNVNPYTGQAGTVNPYAPIQRPYYIPQSRGYRR